VLSERSEAGIAVWECRVGHRYSAESLADNQSDSVEAALWAAICALEDRSRLLERMADQFEATEQMRSAHSVRRRAQSALEEAQTVRQALTQAAEITLRKLAEAEPERVARNGGGA
jgi:two-component system, chemotaxis family, protein-glutamate methylesterase/glutaminase